MNRIAAMSLMMVSSPALAGVSGWAWSDCVSASCTPSTGYQYNSSGATNTVTRLGVGSYLVVMPGIASGGGNAQATAYGGNGSCQVLAWGTSGADQNVYVNCYNAAGALADQYFNVLFYDHGTWTPANPRESAYAWSDLATPVGKHFAPSSYRYNSTPGAVSITKVYTGTYDVMVPNMRTTSIIPMVTAYGGTPARCAALDWYGMGYGLNVRVECTNLSGALIDTQFSFAVVAGAPANADADLAFRGAGLSVDAYGNLNTLESWYDVPGYRDWDVTTTRTGVGAFTVTLPGLAPLYDTFIATTQPSAIGTRCNVGGWSSYIDTTVSVYCYDGLGNPYDAGFTLLWQTSAL